MKSRIQHTLLALALLSTISLQLSTFAQGTAFSYQGRLNTNGSPANGIYDVRFTIYDALTSGNQVGAPVTNSATGVTNGLFAVTLDFGNGVFTGTNRWLEIAARTNGAASFTTLAPRQQILPTPYAIMANTASNLLGTLPAAQLSGTIPASQLGGTVVNSQLANSSITVTAGTGLTGGGAVALGGSTTLNNAGVLSVAGNADITASTLNGAVTLGDTATSANTANTIVKRDASGNFTNTSITLTGNLSLPATTANAGIIYSGGSPFIQAYGSQNFFAGSGAGNMTLILYGLYGGNTGIGYQALYSVTNGYQNTAVGGLALGSDTSGMQNTAVGYQALRTNTIGSYNTAVGFDALISNTNGNNNTAIGYDALQNITTGGNNTASGYQALQNNSADNNTANGSGALLANSVGRENTANGYKALRTNTNGCYNTADGANALYYNQSGSNNTANGYEALYLNVSGSHNAALGDNAGRNNQGDNNTAVGYQALYYNTNGSGNIALGYQAGYNFSAGGSNNIYIGNPGVSNDAGVIRIGGNGQTQTFIAGVINGDGGGLMNLNASQLSSGTISLAQLPGAVVTNNASGVTLSGTFNGKINATGGLVVENRTSDPPSPATGQIWLRTDL